MQRDHGEVEFSFEGRVFEMRLIGAINRETSQRAQRTHREVLDQRDLSKPWGLLVDMTDYLGHTPDAEDGSDEMRAWCIERNLYCEAYVYGDNGFKKSMIEMFLSNCEVQVPCEFFATRDEAMRWLNHQLAS